MKKWLTFILLFLSFGVSAQMLTFNFDGLAGNEISATSNSNVAGITNAVITRTGLTAAANADRFNSNNFPTTAVIDVNKYLSFSVTPSPGNVVGISSIIVSWQRSGTGPQALELRSSLDGYTATLGTVATNTGTSTITSTFTFSNASNSAINFRLYFYNASSTTGTAGPGDFPSGNDIIVNGDALVGKITNQDGAWTDPNIWTPVGVPLNTEAAIVAHNVYNNNGDIYRDAQTTINPGKSFGTNFSWKSTANTNVYGTFRLDPSGNIDASGTYLAPLYFTGSTLEYNNGGTFNRNAEWSTSTTYGTPGYPCNVVLSNSTNLVMDQNNGASVARGISGNLTINTGSTFNMGAMAFPIIVKGNVTNSGTLTLGSVFGGDLKVGGNFTTTGTLNISQRALFFTGANGVQPQTINSSVNPLVIEYLNFEGTGTTLQLNTDLTVQASATGNVITWGNTGNDILDINGKTLKLGITNGTANQISGTGKFKGSTTSILDINGTGNIGTIAFASGSEQLSKFIINRTDRTLGVTLGSDLTLNFASAWGGSGTNHALQINTGIIDIANYNLIFAAGASHNASQNYASQNVRGWIATTGTGEVRATTPFSSYLIYTVFGFPVGDLGSAGFSPVMLYQNSRTGNGYVAMRAVNVKHPQVAGTQYIKRYWTLTTSSGITAFNYDIGLNYRIPDDVVGAPDKQGIWNASSSSWTNIQALANTTSILYFDTRYIYYPGLATLPGTTGLDFTAADQFAYTGVYFRTNSASGTWADKSKWDYSLDGGLTWIAAPAPVVPNQNNAGRIEVLNGHTMTINDNQSMINAFVRTGGNLRIEGLSSATAPSVTIGGTGTNLTVEAGAKLSLSNYININSINSSGTGTVLVKTSGNVYVENNFNVDGNSITSNYIDATSKLTYENGSIFEWDNQYQMPSSNAISSGGSAFKTVNTPDTVTMRFSKANSNFTFGGSTNITINATIEANASFNIGGNGSKSVRGGFRGNSTLTQTNAGAWTLMNGSIISGTVIIKPISNQFIIAPSATTTVPVGANIKLISPSEDAILLKQANGILNINGIADITAMQIANSSGSVNVSSTGTLKIANAEGLFGANAAITSGTLTLAQGSTVSYNKNGNQTITTQAAQYHHLLLDSSGNKTAPLSTLPIKGDFIINNSAVFVHNGGLVQMNGTLAQAFLNNNTAVEPLFYNIEFNNAAGAFINSAITVEKKLAVPAGILNVNNRVTLKSTATNTANIGNLSGATLNYGANGKFRVERYVAQYKKWQFLSFPVLGPVYARDTWQEGYPNTTLSDGYGMQITTSNGVTTGGFDASPIAGATPSVKYLDFNAQTYTGISSTIGFDMSKGNTTPGYSAYVRGDRSISPDPSYTLGNTTTLRADGKIYQGTVSSEAIPPTKFGLVGNPYPSAVKIADLRMNGQQLNNVYIWDPTLTGTYLVGGYRQLTWNAGANAYAVTPSGGLYPATITDLQSGQAFMVQNNFASAYPVVFGENAKTDNSVLVSRDPVGKIFCLNMNKIADTGKVLLDGVSIFFDASYKNEVDAMDALKMLDGDENISLLRNNKTLFAEMHKPVAEKDTFYLKTVNLKQGKYAMAFKPIGLSAESLFAYIVDKYTNTQERISLDAENEYQFTVDANTLSAAADRFYIVFRKINSNALSSGIRQVIVAPNPIVNGQLQLHAYNFPGGNYTLKIFNNAGQLVQQEKVFINPILSFVARPLKQLAKGSYQLILIGNDGEVCIARFMIL